MTHGRLRVDLDHNPGLLRYKLMLTTGFPGGSDGKESSCNAGDLDLIHGLGRSPGRGHGNPLQYSCLENPHGQRAWCATAHGVAKSDATKLLGTHSAHHVAGAL